MLVKKVTVDYVRNSDEKNYNEQEWLKKINRYLTYGDTTFFEDEEGQFYVEYTINEGIRFFSEFNYSSTLSNTGFLPLHKFPITSNGLTFKDVVELASKGEDQDEVTKLILELDSSDTFELWTRYFIGADGSERSINPEARDYMRENSIKFETVYTKLRF